MTNYKVFRGISLTIVNGISATATAITFQPAVGVTVCITSIFLDGESAGCNLYDGTLASSILGSGFSSNNTEIQMYISNTNYLLIGALASGKSSGYSGYEIL